MEQVLGVISAPDPGAPVNPICPLSSQLLEPTTSIFYVREFELAFYQL